MDKNLFKNQWILTGLFILISVVFSYIGPALSIFGINNISTATVGIFMGAFFVGYIYAMYFNEPIPKQLKINVTVIYTAFQIMSAIALLVVFGVAYPVMVLISIGLPLVYAVIIYLLISLGSKAQLDAVKRAKDKAKK